MREALKHLIEKAEGGVHSGAGRVDPHERVAHISRLRKPDMTDDEIEELVRVVEAV
jgi:hypothetical protein